ncbi:MAG: hypothetical protein HY064_13580 [Bacteroidetes bacterium]|nr:hypothetical protein [Bacteroidota bacterium]
MKTRSRRIIFLFCFFLCSISAIAGLQPIFRHLGAEEGMTSGYTNCLFKDHYGFLWIGTANGLNRFDGKNVVQYVHRDNDSLSLGTNEVDDICEDDRGMLWIATKGGLSVFDPETKKFSNYSSEGTGDGQILFYKGVRSVCFFDHRIWMGLADGIVCATTDKIKFTLIPKKDLHAENKGVHCVPKCMWSTKHGLWISTFTGVYLTTDGQHFFCSENNPQNIPLLNRGFIGGMQTEGDSLIWFVNWRFPGLYRYNIFTHVLDSVHAEGMHGINFMSICRIDKDHFWGGTITDGIISIDIHSGKKYFIMPHRFDPNSMSDAEIQGIMMDEEGTVFIATKRGVDYANPVQTQFRVYRNDPADSTAFPSQAPIAIEEDAAGMLWMGTMSNGLYSLDPTTGRCTRFPLTGDFNRVWNIFSDENKILVSTDGGLCWLDMKNKKVTLFDVPDTLREYLSGYVTFMCRDKQNCYWFGLWQTGILKYDPVSRNAILFSKADRTHHLETASPTDAFIDENNNLWYSHIESPSITRMNISDFHSQTFTISSNRNGHISGFLQCMERDNNGNIWTGSSQGGLYRYDAAQNIFRQYDQADGLSNNYIICIQKDKKGILWISTANGLNRLDPATGKISAFSVSDGLPSNQFVDNPATITSSGKLFFGCDNFLVAFEPDSIIQNPHFPPAKIYAYEISGISHDLRKDEKEIFLSYKDKSVNFIFGAINFIDPEKTNFAYKLDGFDKDWNFCGKEEHITYTNLPPGDFIFRVKATNRFGEWNTVEQTLLVHVDGPFWKTWWFFMLCVLSGIAVTALAYYMRLRQVMRLQEIRNKISKDLHDEIGSSLSSISIYSEVAKKMSAEKAPDISEIISNIGDTARSAMENMSDIVWAINPVNDKFDSVVNRLQLFAKQLFEAKQISFELSVPETLGDVRLTMQQRRNVYLVLKEAVNNVAKYSEAENCSVTIRRTDKKINVEVKDDGKGFAETGPSLGGNGLLNMKQRIEELNGIFNIISGIQQGTTISFQFES